MKLRLGIICVGVLMTAFSHAAQAASLYIDPPFSTLYRGDALNYEVRLDVDEAAGECVNAVDAVVSYPSNIDPVDISIGNSIFSMWVEPPTINEDQKTITFAGGIPNGYCGRVSGDPELTNVLAEFVFRSPGFVIGGDSLDSDSTDVQLVFADSTTAYLNDGFGTPAQLQTYPATISLNDERGETLVDTWKDKVNADTIPPEKFSIFLEQQDKSDKYFIVFNTTDKQTGIDVYQVMEEPLAEMSSFSWGRADAPWIETRSPYILQDQTLNSTIRVKAIDKAGNEYIATLVPDASMRQSTTDTMMNVIVFMVIAVLIFVLLSIGVFFVRRRNKTVRQDVTADTDTNTDVHLAEEEEDAMENEHSAEDQNNKI